MRALVAEHVLTPAGWISPGRIAIDDAGMITAVAASEDENAERIAGFVVPGVANLHSHAFQRALSGLTENAQPGIADSFWTWRTRMYALAEAILPDDLEAIAAQLYLEMLERGMTAVGEFHYVHHDQDGSRFLAPHEMSLRILAAAELTGIALTHLPVLYLHGGFGRAPTEAQRRFVFGGVDEFLAMVAQLRAAAERAPLVRVGIAPHSLRAVNEAELREVIAGVDESAPIHLHVAEQEREVAEAIEFLGARPVAFLLDRFAIDQRCTLVHATHIDASERARLAASGAVAGLCPTTEANLGDGLFPAPEYAREGGVFGVGSDSHASVSLTEELRWLEYGQRLATKRRNVILPGELLHETSVGEHLLQRVSRGGARSLAQPMGAIAPGFRADLVVLDGDHPRTCGHGVRTIVDAWIFGGADDAVREVMVGGRTVVREGRHIHRDRIAASYRRVMRRLLA